MKKNNIIKAICASFVVAIFVGVITYKMTSTHYTNHYYPKTTIVYEIDRTLNQVRCKDYSGHMWEFEDDRNDWSVGDICSMTIYDNQTARLDDDSIVYYQYDGHANTVIFNN